MNDDECPLPPELGQALADEPDGARLARLWGDLSGADTPLADARAKRTASWRVVQQAITRDAPARVAGSIAPAAPARGRRLAAVAAAVLLATLGGVLADSLTRERLLAAPGKQARVTLPDGSVAELAGGSSLTWRRGFRAWPVGVSQRTVDLTGTAFFAVRKDGRPFTVRTFNADVQVLGTRFGVRAREGDENPGTVVQVEEGRVRFGRRDRARIAPRASVDLGPGQQSRLASTGREPSAPETVAVERIAVWRRGGFAAFDAPLTTILSDLEQHYGVRIALRNRDAGAQHLTLYYPEPTPLARIVADLCTARGLSFRPTNGGFELE